MGSHGSGLGRKSVPISSNRPKMGQTARRELPPYSRKGFQGGIWTGLGKSDPLDVSHCPPVDRRSQNSGARAQGSVRSFRSWRDRGAVVAAPPAWTVSGAGPHLRMVSSPDMGVLGERTQRRNGAFLCHCQSCFGRHPTKIFPQLPPCLDLRQRRNGGLAYWSPHSLDRGEVFFLI